MSNGVIILLTTFHHFRSRLLDQQKEVSSTTHVSTGVENFASAHNIVDMKEFTNIYKVDVLQQALSTDEAFKQIEKRAENGSQHIFVWLTQEN